MLLHSMGVGITRVFTYSATSALFLSRYDADKLPYVYVIAAVVTSLFGLGYGWLGDRVKFRRLLSMNLGFTLGMFLLLRGLLEVTGAPWPTLVAAVWTELLWALVHLEFWGLAGRLLDVRQAKRLFGLIGAGETSAAILGGVVLGPLVGVIGTPNLLLVAALGTSFSLLAYRRLAVVFSERLEGTAVEADQADVHRPKRERTSSAVARRYVRLVYAAVAVSFTAFFFVDMGFLTECSNRFPDEDQLAAFLGPFAAAANTGVFIVRAFLTGPTLSRYGLTAGLLALPILVGLGAAGVVASASFGAGAFMVFAFMVGTRWVDDSLRESVDTSSVLLLYQPLSPELRNRTMAVTEGMISPLAGGAAGICLLLLDRFMGLDAVRICSFVVSFAFAWVALVLALRSSYLKVLLEALGRRRLSAEELSFTDGHTVAALRRGLASPHAPEVIYCLGVLEGADPDQHRETVGQLLGHPAPMVRREAVERVERLGLSASADEVRRLALGDEDPAVRGAAIKALCALGEEEAIDEVVPLLDDPDPEVRMGAMVGLLRNGGIDGVMAAGVHLRAWVGSEDPLERAFAAQVLGAAGIRGFYRPLLPLLEDPAAQVRRQALEAARLVPHRRVQPLLVSLLGHPVVGTSAAAALAAGGEEVVALLEPILLAPPNGKAGQRAGAAMVLGMVGCPCSVRVLASQLLEPDPDVRAQVYHSLARCRWRPGPGDEDRVRAALDHEVACAAWYLAAAADLGDRFPVVARSLHGGVKGVQARVLALLAFLYPLAEEIATRLTTDGTSADRHAYALEALDSLLPVDFKGPILPLYEGHSLSGTLHRLAPFHPQQSLGAEGRLEAIIDEPPPWVSTWMRACAVHSVGTLRLTAHLPSVERLLGHPDPLLGQTAAWAAETLGRAPAATQSGGREMFPTVERILILKSADIFSEVPDDQLVPLAAIVTEVEVRKGQAVFEKGDSGTAMFVVVEGTVRVHDGDRTLRELGPREVFGELSALDPEPRSASVTAVADTLLFRIDQEPLLELLTGQPGMVRGVIRTLARLVRNRPGG